MTMSITDNYGRVVTVIGDIYTVIDIDGSSFVVQNNSEVGALFTINSMIPNSALPQQQE